MRDHFAWMLVHQGPATGSGIPRGKFATPRCIDNVVTAWGEDRFGTFSVDLIVEVVQQLGLFNSKDNNLA